MAKHMRLTWGAWGTMAFSLAKSIHRHNEKFDLVIGIARGGIPLAMVVSDELGVRLEIINVKSYTGVKKRTKPKILSTISESIKGKRILIVDDLLEEGKTMESMVNYFRKMKPSKIKTAVLFTKPWSKFDPDFYFKSVDRWVVFPWEYKEFSSLNK